MNYLCRKIETFIGVHIRRTDYLNHLKNTYLVEPVKLDYFYRAMDFYQVKLLTVVYVPAIMWLFDCVVETISVNQFKSSLIYMGFNSMYHSVQLLYILYL